MNVLWPPAKRRTVFIHLHNGLSVRTKKKNNNVVCFFYACERVCVRFYETALFVIYLLQIIADRCAVFMADKKEFPFIAFTSPAENAHIYMGGRGGRRKKISTSFRPIRIVTLTLLNTRKCNSVYHYKQIPIMYP